MPVNCIVCLLLLISRPLVTVWSGQVSFSGNGPWFAAPATLRCDKKMRIVVSASGNNPFRIGVVSNIPNGRNVVERMEQTDCTNRKPADHAQFECSFTPGYFSVVLANQGTRENHVAIEIYSK